jgi:hypothetical protein
LSCFRLFFRFLLLVLILDHKDLIGYDRAEEGSLGREAKLEIQGKGSGGGWSANVKIYQFVSIYIASSCSLEKLFIKEIGIQGSIDLIYISLFWPGLRANIFELHLKA